MQDAAVLANCLYDMKTTSIEDVKAALEDYQEQRFEHVKTQYEASQWNAKVIYGHVRVSHVYRGLTIRLKCAASYSQLQRTVHRYNQLTISFPFLSYL